MSRTKLLWLGMAACGMAACGNGGSKGAAPSEPAGFCGDEAAAVERRVEDLLARMTLEEKLEQMHGSQVAPIDGTYHTPDNERLGIPGFRMIDGPRGVSKIAGHATAFPVGSARGATWDPALEERVGEAMGEEARAKGANVLLAPTINLLRHPRWGRAQETYGEDPLHVGRLAVGFVRGVQRHVAASAKHFAANTIEDTRFEVNVSIDERTLREVYLPHFRMAVREGGVATVMAAYNKLNGQHCAENAHLVREILKRDWGFRGLVESDWILGVRSTAPSARAGLDIEMPAANFYGDKLRAAIEAGEVPVEAIDEAVRRILRVKLCFGLDRDRPAPDPADVVESPAHRELALEVARRAIVLLRNRRDALPLDAAKLGRLAVVGPLAEVANLGDTGSSDVSPSSAISPLEGIRERAAGIEVSFARGPELSAEERGAVAAADAVVVVAGLSAPDEGENIVGAGDRKSLRLPAEQEAVILGAADAARGPVIVVLEGGSAVDVEPWIERTDALLMAWYPGQEGGRAIAQILFGDANPSGRLPVTFARSAADLPPFDNESLEVSYGFLHGYRLLDREGREPRYPFGFGLSYTSFALSDLRLERDSLGPEDALRPTVRVENTGPRAGIETVQLYVGYEGSRVERPLRDLRGFGQVALEPGESRALTLEVPVRRLAFYDVERSAWEVEPITYRVEVGTSSRDLPLTARFRVRR